MPRDNEEISFKNFIGTPGAEEFNLIQQTQNPIIPDDTAYIWVLTSRHTILKRCINCPQNPAMYIVNKHAPDAIKCDVDDDFVRFQTALKIGQKITAKKANKNIHALTIEDYEKHAPYIIYNGLDEQNEDLIEVLNRRNVQSNQANGLINLGLPNYPVSKFIIFGLPKELRHTGGQFHLLADFLQKEKQKKEHNPKLVEIYKKNVSVVIVSSAYHMPRIRRYFNSSKYDNPLPHARITLYMTDREFERPCITRDCIGEMEKLVSYANQGFIGEPITSSNWYNMVSLQQWTPLRAVQCGLPRLKVDSEKIKALDLAVLNTPPYKKLTK